MDNPAYVAELKNDFGTKKQNDNTELDSHTFDEALELTQVGRFHYVLTLICGFCFMAVMAETMGVGMIMPLIKCDLTATQTEQGLLASAGFFGIVLSSHMMGFLADTWGRVRTLRYSLVLAATATIISAFSVNTWMLIAFRFLNGFFISGCQACVFSLCGEFHSNRTRVRYVTLLAIFLPFALMFMPAMALVILPLQIDFVLLGIKFASWRLFFAVNMLISFAGLIGLSILPETPKYLLVHGSHDASLAVLRRIYAMNTGDKPENFPVKSIVLQTGGADLSNIHGVKDALKMIWSQTTPLFYKERVLQTFNICFSLFSIYGISQGLFMWFPTILNELIRKSDQDLKVCTIIGNMDVTTAKTVNSCTELLDYFMFEVLIMIGAVFTVVFIIFAYTIDIVGKSNLLMIWLVVACVCAAIMHWISEFAAIVIVLTLLMSVGNCGGIIGTIAIEFYPAQINAMGMCFAMMIGRLGSVAGGNIIGTFLFTHCNILLWGVVALIAVLIALAAVLPDKKRERVASDLTVTK
ncbi:synaptic vesicle glycoprotein 2B isoform X1 [Ceratitis capitata]|uniref:synaptic vesicle glycoprotein 2B isoform X1 n=1 Tax=Ceratitis capitata TaxID=7213 RepID=UPI0006188011|nr:synaptic vesicle glycoprotein 2B isoform X1 [Ceratitis capitata]